MTTQETKSQCYQDMVSNNVFWSSDKSNQTTANLYLADNKALFMMATSEIETYSNNVIFQKVKALAGTPTYIEIYF